MELRQVTGILAFMAILGGIARIGMAPSAYIWGSNSMQELVFGFVACILMGISILGIYLHALPRAGILGIVGTIAISISCMLTTALVWSNMLGMVGEDHRYIDPLLGTNSLLMLVGQLAFCIAMFRARTYPLWAVILFLVYPAIYFIPGISDLGSVAWGLCFIAFGASMLRGNSTAASSTHLSSAKL